MGSTRLKKELKRIVDFLGWFGTSKCPNCGSLVKFSVLDSDEGAMCLKCNNIALVGDLRLSYSNVSLYKSLFLGAIYLSISEYFSDLRSAIITAFTSLEVFLNNVIEYQFKKRGIDNKIIECILIKTKPNLSSYRELLEAMNIRIKNWEALREVAKIRDDLVHRGKSQTEGDIIKVFDRISSVFIELSGYYLSDIDEGTTPREPIEEV